MSDQINPTQNSDPAKDAKNQLDEVKRIREVAFRQSQARARMQRKKDDLNQERLQFIFKTSSLVLALASVVAGVFGVFSFSKPSDSKITAEQLNKIDSIKLDVLATKTDLQKLEERLDELAKNPGQSIQLNDLSASLTDTHTKVSSLEKAIMDNPTKALELPLLRKDLEALRESSKSELVTTRQEIERIYDLNKWFLGLMITSLLAIIGLAISSLFKKGGGASPA